MNNITKRLGVWAIVIALILLIPLVLTLLGSGVDGEGWHWTLFDFIVMSSVLFGIGLTYELVARRSKKTVYRVAFGIGLTGAFLLFWLNAAMGLIGNEGQSANLLYGLVFVVGLIGSLISRFKPLGMSRTLLVAALVQISIPIIALVAWPQISWGEAGMFGVFILNSFFALLFIVSALLFRHANASDSKAQPIS